MRPALVVAVVSALMASPAQALDRATADRPDDSPVAQQIHVIYAVPSDGTDNEFDTSDVWRTIFDHYVFCANGDPAAHLPPQAQGVLGPATPEQLGRMRATLRQIMGKL